VQKAEPAGERPIGRHLEETVMQSRASGSSGCSDPQSGSHRSVERVAAIIEAVGAHPAPVRLTDVARETGLDTGTTHRILSALVRRGYIHKDTDSRRYSIGFEIFRLGASDPARAITAQRAHGFLTRLASELGATVLIGGREGTKVHLYRKIDRSEPNLLSLTREFNPYLDAHATSIGKVLMAYSAENEVGSLYAENPLQRHTSKTVTSVGRLLAELRLIRGRRYALENGEWRPGIDGFAVPIFNPVGHVNLAIWVLTAPGSSLMRNVERGVTIAAGTAHDIICYATGKPPLVWPVNAALDRVAPRGTRNC
jgi:IclR family acetate operon transcriptional repressor